MLNEVSILCPDSWDRTIRNVIHPSKKDWKGIVQRRAQEKKSHAPAKKTFCTA